MQFERENAARIKKNHDLMQSERENAVKLKKNRALMQSNPKTTLQSGSTGTLRGQ